MNEAFQAFIQFMQAISAPVVLLVALSTLRNRGDDKASILTGMQKDIEHIKENTACIPAQSGKLVEIEAMAKSAHKRLDDHLRYDHAQKKEES